MSGDRRLQVGVGLLSAAVIGYEIGLTRLFSFLQHYHYTFLVVSGAVCGLGLGAALSAAIRPGGGELHRHLARWGLLCGCAMAMGALVLAQWPRLPLAVLGGVAGLPFVAAGVYLALAFRYRSEESSRLYFWDLVGAGLGILCAVVAIEWAGAPGGLVLAGFLAWTAGSALADGRTVERMVALALLVIAAVSAGREAVALDGLAAAADKPMFRALAAEHNPGAVVETRWSAFARTDVVDRTGDTGLNLYVDGGAGSYMFKYPGDYRRLFFLRGEAAFFPYYFGGRERALIIGPGGGADVLYALMTGWKHIEAVEINPEIVELVRERGDYNGHIYDLEDVAIHIGDGRNYLERSERRYDLIALPLVYAEAADLVGYALAENYLFTREAFASYLDHLDDGGRLALVVHNHALMLRVVATLADLWRERGLESARLLDHLVVVNGTRADPGREAAYRPLLLVQNKPYTAYQLGKLRKAMDEVGLHAYFLPGLHRRAAFAPLYERGLAAFVAASDSDVSPVTDDRPFFYDATPGLDPKLGRLLLAAAVLCALVLLAPLASPRMRQGGAGELPPWLWALFAAGLGAGFMLVEIHLLQRCGLFLGYPALTLSVALFALLVGTGVGSLLGSRLALLARPAGIGLVAIGVGAVCLLYGFLLDGILDGALAWSLAVRVGLTLVLVVPLGAVLGFCFPACLRLGGRQRESIVPWLWSVNGFFSVLGSVAAVSLGMEWGARSVLVAGAVVYALAGGLLYGFGRGAPGVDLPTAKDGRADRSAALLVLAVVVCWFVAFVALGAADVEPSAGRSRPAVAAEVWPRALF